MDANTLKNLSRVELQKLAKTHGIKANLKSATIIKSLLAVRPQSVETPSPRPTAPEAAKDKQPDLPRVDTPQQLPANEPVAKSRVIPTRSSNNVQERLVSTSETQQPEAGPSHLPHNAMSLGVFTLSSASQAPWPPRAGPPSANCQFPSVRVPAPPNGVIAAENRATSRALSVISDSSSDSVTFSGTAEDIELMGEAELEEANALLRDLFQSISARDSMDLAAMPLNVDPVPSDRVDVVAAQQSGVAPVEPASPSVQSIHEGEPVRSTGRYSRSPPQGPFGRRPLAELRDVVDPTPLATDAQLHDAVHKMASMARFQKTHRDKMVMIDEESTRLDRKLSILRQSILQERAQFVRLRTYLDHVNMSLGPRWIEQDIWDKVCKTRIDRDGYDMEIETDDEEEAEYRRENPLPPNAKPTEIIMNKWTRHEWSDDESESGVADRPAQLSQGGAQTTPKRRRTDDVPADRATKRHRGSAGATPAPDDAKRQAAAAGGRAIVPLAGIMEEEEHDMVSVLSILTQPVTGSE